MKKLISLITIIALLLTFLTLFASCGGAPKVASVQKTTYKDVINWSYDADTKTLKIESATAEAAEMPSFAQASELPWYGLRTAAVRLELSGISKISDNAFSGMYYIKEISFGSNVTEIGKCAFAFCISLVDLTLPEGITAIGESAFEACANLKSAKLPSTVTSIGNRAFAYDHLLTEVTLDEALSQTYDSKAVFEGIENMPKINVLSATAPAPEGGETTDSSSETEASTDAPATEESATETDAPKPDATDAPEPQDTKTTIIAIVILVLVIIGLIVGGVLLARSNKKQTKDSRTVRKNDNDKYNKNGNSKGKKK